MAKEETLRQAAVLLLKIAQEKEEGSFDSVTSLLDTAAPESASDEAILEEPAAETPVVDEEVTAEVAPVTFKCDKCDHSADLAEINSENEKAGVPAEDKVTETDRVGCPQCGTGVMSVSVETAPADATPSIDSDLDKEAGVLGNMANKIKEFIKSVPPATVHMAENLTDEEIRFNLDKERREKGADFLTFILESFGPKGAYGISGPDPLDDPHRNSWQRQLEEKEFEIRRVAEGSSLSHGAVHSGSVIDYLIAKGLELGILDPQQMGNIHYVAGKLSEVRDHLKGGMKTAATDKIAGVMDILKKVLPTTAVQGITNAIHKIGPEDSEKILAFVDGLDNTTLENLVGKMDDKIHQGQPQVKTASTPFMNKAILVALLTIGAAKGALAADHLDKHELSSKIPSITLNISHADQSGAIAELGQLAQKVQNDSNQKIQDNKDADAKAEVQAEKDRADAEEKAKQYAANDHWQATASINMTKLARYL